MESPSPHDFNDEPTDGSNSGSFDYESLAFPTSYIPASHRPHDENILATTDASLDYAGPNDVVANSQTGTNGQEYYAGQEFENDASFDYA